MSWRPRLSTPRRRAGRADGITGARRCHCRDVPSSARRSPRHSSSRASPPRAAALHAIARRRLLFTPSREPSRPRHRRETSPPTQAATGPLRPARRARRRDRAGLRSEYADGRLPYGPRGCLAAERRRVAAPAVLPLLERFKRIFLWCDGDEVRRRPSPVFLWSGGVGWGGTRGARPPARHPRPVRTCGAAPTSRLLTWGEAPHAIGVTHTGRRQRGAALREAGAAPLRYCQTGRSQGREPLPAEGPVARQARFR